MYGFAFDVRGARTRGGGGLAIDPSAAAPVARAPRPQGLIRPDRPAVAQAPGPDIRALLAHAALAQALPAASSADIKRLVAAGVRGPEDL